MLILCFTAFWKRPLNGWLKTQFPKMVADSNITIWNYKVALDSETEGVKNAITEAIEKLIGESFCSRKLKVPLIVFSAAQKEKDEEREDQAAQAAAGVGISFFIILCPRLCIFALQNCLAHTYSLSLSSLSLSSLSSLSSFSRSDRGMCAIRRG